MNNNNTPLLKISFAYKLLFLFSIFLVCLYLVSVASSLLLANFGSTDTILNLQITLQNLVVFTLPAISLAFFVDKQPFVYLRLYSVPNFKQIFFVVLIYATSIPLMNFIIDWNANIHLPETLKPIENVLRQYEDAAQALTDQMITGKSLVQIIVLVITIGCLTGFGEEIFFRGAFTQILIGKPLNKHAAIWIGAFFFSLLHFQFFGFFPRMLLGAFFGYLLVWTDCLWLPILAHALNNSMAVVSKYLCEQQILTTQIDQYGTFSNMPYLAIVSTILVALFIAKRKFFHI